MMASSNIYSLPPGQTLCEHPGDVLNQISQSCQRQKAILIGDRSMAKNSVIAEKKPSTEIAEGFS